MSALRILEPGLLALLQDAGRRGHYRLGLTDGGPVDPVAFGLCNRLLQNAPDAATVELSLGGARLIAETDTWICLAGAPMPLLVNGEERAPFRALPVRAGDSIAIGHARAGCRAYLGVAGGFRVSPAFGSIATVLREGIGGLAGCSLQAGDRLPCEAGARRRPLVLPAHAWPRYPRHSTLRVVPGYQQRHFSRAAKRRFYGSRYTVTDRADRMGYRLAGPAVRPALDGILSEGISHGAIQLPADGQPIVLLNDRQTIGGYPKIGAALSLDVAALAQQTAGGEVVFTPISPQTARRALRLARIFEANRPIEEGTA